MIFTGYDSIFNELIKVKVLIKLEIIKKYKILKTIKSTSMCPSVIASYWLV
jgi:hypothetical protein